MNYIIKEIDNLKIIINRNILNLMNEYQEYEADKYKNQILIIGLCDNDICILFSKEEYNNKYMWYWNINDDYIYQNKDFKLNDNLNNIIVSKALEYLNTELNRKD